LARSLLFLTLICETSLSKRERMELFMDLYANCMIRDKTDAYLQGVLNELIQLVTEDERCTSVLKKMVKFDQLKFKDRDEIEDIFSSWYSNHPFDVEKLRDDRLRGHFKDRYDARKNICDWDFSMYMKKLAPMMNNREYIGWRMTGTAFETRLASNNVPNRTFGSYVPGRDVSIIRL
jgi:dynein assembly factor 3, axonemal